MINSYKNINIIYFDKTFSPTKNMIYIYKEFFKFISFIKVESHH